MQLSTHEFIINQFSRQARLYARNDLMSVSQLTSHMLGMLTTIDRQGCQ